jgi:dTDP-4-amino-4,6-dideoxygalactose transaminase
VKKIQLSKPLANAEVKEAAIRAIESGTFILGNECKAFEQELAKHTGTKHGVLTSSWTTGVYLLLSAMGLDEGDEVIAPSHTAFPSLEPIIHRGGKPVLVDVDDTFCLDPAAVEAAVTPRTVGILPVHLYGHPADLDRIFAIAKKHDLWVIEDCAQAQGAAYRGETTGGEWKTVGCMGLAGAFSFFPSKNLTVLGDGGCICLDDDDLARRLRMLRNHGREDKYHHEFPGWNMRFNEIQGAIGRVALRALDPGNARRREIAAIYGKALAGVVATPPVAPYARPVYHMYVVRVPGGGKTPERRDALAKFLKDRGVGTGIHYPVPNHLQPAMKELYAQNDWTQPALPKTEAMVNDILSIPMHPELTDEDAAYVCEGVKAFFA